MKDCSEMPDVDIFSPSHKQQYHGGNMHASNMQNIKLKPNVKFLITASHGYIIIEWSDNEYHNSKVTAG